MINFEVQPNKSIEYHCRKIRTIINNHKDYRSLNFSFKVVIADSRYVLVDWDVINNPFIGHSEDNEMKWLDIDNNIEIIDKDKKTMLNMLSALVS